MAVPALEQCPGIVWNACNPSAQIERIGEFRMLVGGAMLQGRGLSTLGTAALSACTRGMLAATGPDAMPVIVPCRNEQDDLPATLHGLAVAGLRPVVVDNGSTDNTAEVATDCGAVVIPSGTGRKMAAIQAGIRWVLDQGDRALFTDGDTIVGPRWGRAMNAMLEAADEGSGAAAFGNSLLWNGESWVTDTVLSAAKIARGIRTAMTGAPVMRGHNFGIKFDGQGRVAAELLGLDPNIFVTDEQSIRGALRHAEAKMVAANSMASLVVTRNDRCGTLSDRMRRDYWARRCEGYEVTYGPTK